MCNPATMANLTMGTQTAGVGLQTVGAFTNAYNQRQVNKANARMADWAADDAIRRGRLAEGRHRAQTRRMIGSQRAAFAGRGIVASEGSPLDILISTDMMGEIDAATIRENAEREAFGRRVEASNFRAQASANNPFLAGGSTLLTGAGQVADRWYRYRREGVV